MPISRRLSFNRMWDRRYALLGGCYVLGFLDGDDAEDKIEALDAGADDYITKPFHMGELMARVRSAVRRSESMQNNKDVGDCRWRHRARYGSSSGSKARCRRPSHSKRIRPAAVSDVTTGSAYHSCPFVDLCLGDGIWERTGIYPHIRAPAPEETRRRPCQASIPADRLVYWLPIQRSGRRKHGE
jgi:hypothetical protein